MQHRAVGDRLVIATHNNGKLHEFRSLLAPYVKTVLSSGELHLLEPIENGATFAENALLKARSAASLAHCVALADDSGLCVTSLNNQPGIYSARWGGDTKNFNHAMHRVHDEIANALDRSAFFICVLALCWPDGHHELIEGRIDGHIAWPPRGDQGHGYDPIFVPTGHNRTFAEMDMDEKNAISHRGIAVHKLIHRLQAA
jgi:XTP/dITP diphosphohydrolase